MPGTCFGPLNIWAPLIAPLQTQLSGISLRNLSLPPRHGEGLPSLPQLSGGWIVGEWLVHGWVEASFGFQKLSL